MRSTNHNQVSAVCNVNSGFGDYETSRGLAAAFWSIRSQQSARRRRYLFFVWKIPGSTADLFARSYFALRLVRSGMEVVAGARIAFPYLLKVNEALLGTSEYERDFNYSGSRVRDDKLEQLPTVSPEVVAA